MRPGSLLSISALLAAAISFTGVYPQEIYAQEIAAEEVSSPFRKPVDVDISNTYTVEIALKSKTSTAVCYENTPGQIQFKNDTTRFIPYLFKLRKLKRKGLKGSKKFKKLRKLQKLALEKCDLSSANIFDENGKTTSAGRLILRLPTGIDGLISAGEVIYNQECFTCHGERRNRSYPTIARAIAGPPMNKQFTEQMIADLVAYLSRFRS